MATTDTLPPIELRERPRWVLWRLETRKGNTTKIPYRVAAPQREASSTDPNSWSSYEDAVKALPNADGIGFVLGDGITGVDLDHCIDEDGRLDPDAEYIVGMLDTYTELSPSGTGLHMLLFGELNVKKHRVTGPWGGHFEVYDKDRFFTITAERYKDTPEKLSTTRQPELDTVCRKVFEYHADSGIIKNARKGNPDLFDKLFDDGDTSDYNSPSEADLALANLIAMKTQDPDTLDRILRRSALVRDKWDGQDGEQTWLRRRVVDVALEGREKSKGLTGDFETDVSEAMYRVEVREEARRRLQSKDVPDDLGLPGEKWSLTDELELPDLDAIYRINKLHPTGGNVVLVAAYKSGKTTLTLNLLRSLADGGPFLGKYEIDPFEGNICIVNYEETPTQWRRHVRKLGIQNTDRIFPIHRRGEGILPLWEPRAQNRLVEWMIEREITYWIMDPTVVAWQGLVDNENDNALVTSFTAALDQVKLKAGISELMLTHHEGRATEGRGRGATRLEDWMDAGWYLSRDDPTSIRTLWAKGRDVEEPRFELEFSEERWTLTAGESEMEHEKKATVADLRKTKNAVMEILAEQGELSQTALGKALKEAGFGMSTNRLGPALSRWVGAADNPLSVRTEDMGGTAKKKVYYLKSKKQPLIQDHDGTANPEESE